MTVAVALAQIGEFSFILATLGRDIGLLTHEATNTLVAAAIVSIILNPLLYRAIDPTVAALSRRFSLERAPADAPEPLQMARRPHAHTGRS